MEVSARQMHKVDAQAVNRYGIDILQMMELAGSHVARFASTLKPHKVIVLYGKGHNGGDGLVAARHLVAMGIPVELLNAHKEYEGATAHQLDTLKAMGVKHVKKIEASDADLIVDALLGSNIKGNPRDEYVRLISEANNAKRNGAEIISIDVPSGLDPDTGSEFSPCIQADFVICIGAMKKGVNKLQCKKYVANVGIPDKAYEDVGISWENIFEKADFIEIK